ncbi:MAG: hypothetical protein RL060_621 [Bacteroidota bacterium]|jgi:hypothetical protein
MKKTGLLVSMLALTLLFGCKKKESDPVPSKNFAQITTLNKLSGDLSTEKYEYNSLNQINSIVEGTSKKVFTYNLDGTLNTIQNSNAGVVGNLTTLTYGSNGLVAKVVVTNGGYTSETINYEYAGNALVKAISGYDTTTFTTGSPVLRVDSYNYYYRTNSSGKDSTYLTFDADNNVVKEERMFNYTNSVKQRINGKYTSRVVAYSTVVAAGSTPKTHYSTSENPNGPNKRGNILNETYYAYVNNKDAGKAVVSSSMNTFNYNVVNNVIKSMDIISIDYTLNSADLTSYESDMSNKTMYFDYK